MSEKIRQRIEPLVHASGLDLEEVELTPAGRRSILRVIVDGDQITLDDVAALSREISTLIDTDPVFGEKSITLEVSSRGVDSPLTLPRHWRRKIGRLVSVTRNDGEKVSGRITAASETEATLEEKGAAVVVALADVKKARIEVEFNRPEQP